MLGGGRYSVNIEDSVIVSEGAIKRGLFNLTTYKTYKAEAKDDIYALSEEQFCIPDKSKCIGMRQIEYSNLNENGLIKEGTEVNGGDVIIGKMTPIVNKKISNKKNGIMYKDTSIQLKHNENGIVDKVQLTVNSDGYQLAKVRIKKNCVPEMADKVSSRSG
jgi:DNA-directed RNA polymerase II subunit RPB2